MRYAYPGCVPVHSRDNLAIVEPRLCGSSLWRTFLLLGLKVELTSYPKGRATSLAVKRMGEAWE